jgi:outer membrane protein TolC
VRAGSGCAAQLSRVSQLPIPKLPPEVRVGLPSDLFRRRPDIRVDERQLAAAMAQLGGAMADLFPKFSLTASHGLQSVSARFTRGSRLLVYIAEVTTLLIRVPKTCPSRK